MASVASTGCQGEGDATQVSEPPGSKQLMLEYADALVQMMLMHSVPFGCWLRDMARLLGQVVDEERSR